jgi:hypothetical protein
MSRAPEILRIPTIREASARVLEDVVDVLRRMVGRATSLVVIPLSGAQTVTASSGAGTRVPGSGQLVEVPDALLQQWRLVVEGSAADAIVMVVDVSTGLALASVTLPTTTGVRAGPWTVTPVLAPLDHTLEARIVGSGSATLLSLSAQARTIAAPAR